MTRRLAVLTSGGDAPGMNAAVRGVVQAAQVAGVEAFAVLEGYEGLVEGRFSSFSRFDLDEALRQGGTVLGTARSERFRTEAGRRTAVENLMKRAITGIVVIGGDGSLTGARVLAEEWPVHAAALGGRSQPPEILGIPASIDNDLPGSDHTLGCDTALTRIVDAVDALESTARSHKRAFVVEVMGRACGWLALAAAIATGADHVLLPENPNRAWQKDLVASLRAGRANGRRQSIVLLAEGATDVEGSPLRAELVARTIRDELGLDTRITVLGHVQRGGVPSARDRLIATRMGRHVAVWRARRPEVLLAHGERLEAAPLQQVLSEPRSLPGFEELSPVRATLSGPAREGSAGRVLIAHVGAPAPGMDAAVRASVRLLHARGLTPLVARNGLASILEDDPTSLAWDEVEGWQARSSTSIGTSRHTRPNPFDLKTALDRHGIQGCILIGGFGALQMARLVEVPTAVVPATISNNVPGTEVSIGCDTALDQIAIALDGLRQSAMGSTDRVFFVEVMGARCGYLARTGGLVGGADRIYTHEEPPDLQQVHAHIEAMRAQVEAVGVGLVVVSDGLEPPWDSHTLARLYESGANGVFDTRVCVLGHLQQGSRPSARDRLIAARLANAATAYVTGPARKGAVVIGLAGGRVVTTPLAAVLELADIENRRPR